MSRFRQNFPANKALSCKRPLANNTHQRKPKIYARPSRGELGGWNKYMNVYVNVNGNVCALLRMRNPEHSNWNHCNSYRKPMNPRSHPGKALVQAGPPQASSRKQSLMRRPQKLQPPKAGGLHVWSKPYIYIYVCVYTYIYMCIYVVLPRRNIMEWNNAIKTIDNTHK